MLGLKSWRSWTYELDNDEAKVVSIRKGAEAWINGQFCVRHFMIRFYADYDRILELANQHRTSAKRWV